MNYEAIKGWWNGLDQVLMYINSVDVDDKSGAEIKSEMYHAVFKMRPDYKKYE